MRLGKRILTERSRRWPRRPDFAAECGLSVRLLGAIERGERTNISEESLAAIEAALGWEPGSSERVRAGLRPLLREDPDLTRLRELWHDLSPDARRMLLAVAEQARRSR